MANTTTLIASIRLTTGASVIDFTSIPATYTDLLMLCSTRASGNALDNGLRFNNDGSAIYSFTQLQTGASTGTPGAARNSNATLARAGGIEPSTYTAGVFNSTSVYIPNYANTTIYKSFIAEGVNENNSTTNYAWFHAGLYRSTSAINRISFYVEAGGNMDAGSMISLYGIKNA